MMPKSTLNNTAHSFCGLALFELRCQPVAIFRSERSQFLAMRKHRYQSFIQKERTLKSAHRDRAGIRIAPLWQWNRDAMFSRRGNLQTFHATEGEYI